MLKNQIQHSFVFVQLHEVRNTRDKLNGANRVWKLSEQYFMIHINSGIMHENTF
jgi:hypothetical protein